MNIRIDLKIFIFFILFILTKQSTVYLLLLAFVILHELGHIIVGLCMGLKIQTMKIMPMGVSVLFQLQKQNRNTKFWVSIAGPITNFVLAAIILAMPEFILQETMIYINILVGTFNLLPIYPLDGGRILETVLLRFYPKDKIEDIINKLSNIIMICLTVLASIGILYLKNIAILIIIVYLWWLRLIENKRHHIKSRIRKILKQEEKVI